jgi:hypothetical protein
MVLVGSTMFVRAALDLEPGQELHTAYFDVAAPLQHRRAAEARLGFKDCCRRSALEERAEVADLHGEMMAVYDAHYVLSQEVRDVALEIMYFYSACHEMMNEIGLPAAL